MRMTKTFPTFNNKKYQIVWFRFMYSSIFCCLASFSFSFCVYASVLSVDLCAFVPAFFPYYYNILSLDFSLHHCWIYIFRQVQTFIVFYRQLVLNKFHRTKPALLIVPASETKRTLFSVEAMLLATYSKKIKIKNRCSHCVVLFLFFFFKNDRLFSNRVNYVIFPNLVLQLTPSFIQ